MQKSPEPAKEICRRGFYSSIGVMAGMMSLLALVGREVFHDPRSQHASPKTYTELAERLNVKLGGRLRIVSAVTNTSTNDQASVYMTVANTSFDKLNQLAAHSAEGWKGTILVKKNNPNVDAPFRTKHFMAYGDPEIARLLIDTVD